MEVLYLLMLSKLLYWIIKKYKNETLSVLTGFIAGSLGFIWPWKEITNSIIINGKVKIINYKLLFPENFNPETIFAFLLIILGILCISILEKYSTNIEE